MDIIEFILSFVDKIVFVCLLGAALLFTWFVVKYKGMGYGSAEKLADIRMHEYNLQRDAEVEAARVRSLPILKELQDKYEFSYKFSKNGILNISANGVTERFTPISIKYCKTKKGLKDYFEIILLGNLRRKRNDI